ncbi:chaperone protein dnaJ 20, chloroplastic-like [Cryptomeria japonica]|uniref:chaperone protein dnaJ 20, chloroplastic-like n=1 Tax=Cryptomeria japonica TaxID=3369 RepID=UPI0027DA0B68|nr:chaperone protein dnaJ 20, chloroplastic-like [Cryptomeria japonica]
MERTTSIRGLPRIKVGSRARRCAVERVTSIRASQSKPPTCSSLYDVLNVPHNVSARDIKSAYRRMALQYHPDVCPPAEKEKCIGLFLKVQEAYETLSNPLLRHDYDCRLQNRLEFSDCVGEKSSKHLWEVQLREMTRRRSGRNSSWGSRMRRRKEKFADHR